MSGIGFFMVSIFSLMMIALALFMLTAWYKMVRIRYFIEEVRR